MERRGAQTQTHLVGIFYLLFCIDMKLDFVVLREEGGAISSTHGGEYKAGFLLECCAA
jgi:hypothetical protein